MANKRPSGKDEPRPNDLVLLLDAELESGSALIVDDAVTARPRRTRRAPGDRVDAIQPGTDGTAPDAAATDRAATDRAATTGTLENEAGRDAAPPEPPAGAARTRPPRTRKAPSTPAATPARQRDASGGRAPRRGTPPVQVAGVEHGNVATEVLEPFVRAIEVLLRGLAESLGEDGDSPATVRFANTVIEYSSPGWGDDVVRVYRSASGGRPAPAPAAGATAATSDSTALAVASAGGPRDRWELGASAAREGNHAVALQLFEEEAREAEVANISQRAAIAYRSASREAGLIGRRDYANMLLRLAGKHYLLVAEEQRTSTRGKVQAYVTAAKCFLQAGNLPLAESCIARARSAADALGEH